MNTIGIYRAKILICVFVACIVFGVQTSYATTYYVSTEAGASDSNPGSLASPWRTLNASVKKLVSGDILYVRGGTYVEKVWLNNNGTASLPITVSAYTGEFPVIDGNGTLPVGDWDGLLGLRGNYLHVSGLEVKNSIEGNHAVGVYVIGHDNTVSGLNVHHVWSVGILVNGDNCIVEDCQVWQSCRANLNGTKTSWGSGLTAARDGVDGITSNGIIRRNIVYNNWGEGLSTYEADGIIIENNIVYNNWAVNIYISDASNVIARRNMVYNTPDNNGRHGWQTNSMLADEVASKPRSINNTIINNLFLNCNISLFSWTGVSGSGLTNLLFANNTLVGSTIGTGSVNSANLIINNIFYGIVPSIPFKTGITFSNNYWKQMPPANAVGPGDLIGDPKLAQTGSIAPGELTGEYFKLFANSPAINRAMVLTEVSEDFFKVVRNGLPDIGAYEYPYTVGISKLNSPSFRLFQNPATNSLTIELSNFQDNEQVQIFNLIGKLTKVVLLSSSRQNINIEDLSSGIYFVRLEQSKNFSVKFIKQ